jgi:RNA polymerase sigma-70 factor (ECF subfamily)
MEDSDYDLMARLGGGDDLALNLLMQRWKDRLAAFLYRMTAHVETAADLTQETFVKLYLARQKYRPDGKFSTYLFSIASNLGRNHARWKKRHPAVSLDAESNGEALLPEAADTAQTPDEAAASADRLKAVNEAIQALPDDLREAMTLFIHEGMGYAEIATVAGCSVKAAETRIYRARQILKENLKHIRS